MRVIVNTDGGCRENQGKNAPASAAFVAYTDGGVYLASQSSTFLGNNNIAEYTGLAMAAAAIPEVVSLMANKPSGIDFRIDSMLIVKQLKEEWSTHDPDMKKLSGSCRALLEEMRIPYRLVWVPREENKEADFLCNLALDGTVKEDLYTVIPASYKKSGKATAGQLFQLYGEVLSPRSVRVDTAGFALCNGCALRLMNCNCPAIVVLDKPVHKKDPIRSSIAEELFGNGESHESKQA